MGIFLIASTSLFGLSQDGIESIIFYVVGVAAVLYSLFTNYELGFLKLIQMRVHLIIDFLPGAFLLHLPGCWAFQKRDLDHISFGYYRNYRISFNEFKTYEANNLK